MYNLLVFYSEELDLGFPGSSMVKNLPVNAKVASLIPGSGRSSGEGNGNSLQDSCLENPMNRGAYGATDLVVTRIRHDWETKQQEQRYEELNLFLVLNVKYV